MTAQVRRRGVLIFGLMMLAAGAAYALKPRLLMADMRNAVNLEETIPRIFGNWKEDTKVIPVQVSPEIQATLDNVYDQTLARTYINSQGQRIMLSIAYGGTQSRSLQVHRPEVCYTAQGFQVRYVADTKIRLSSGASVPVRHLESVLSVRSEPITYWIRMGDGIANTGLDQAFARYKYGLSGWIPDGTLFRVSSVNQNSKEAYSIQSAFITELYSALNAQTRGILFGTLLKECEPGKCET